MGFLSKLFGNADIKKMASGVDLIQEKKAGDNLAEFLAGGESENQ